MKCQVTSNATHTVLISKEIIYKSYQEICSGEKTKVNLGYNNDPALMYVENNSLTSTPPQSFREGNAWISHLWEVFSIFFSHHNIEPNWLDCNWSWGSYDEDLGGWTGCMGKV